MQASVSALSESSCSSLVSLYFYPFISFRSQQYPESVDVPERPETAQSMNHL